MSKLFSVSYGLISYLIFFAVFLYLIAFVGGFLVPKTVDSGIANNGIQAVFINLLLIVIFAIQHTVMARDSFKTWIIQFIPAHLERSTYMLATCVVLTLLFVAWQPLSGVVWQFENPVIVTLLYACFALGWVLVLISTFLTNHFDLFGLRQIYLFAKEQPYTNLKFTEMVFYHWMRHPMMLGLLIAFWSTPTMTMSHFLFSVGMTCYILVGIHYEEKSLVAHLGDDYVNYREQTPMLFPNFNHKKVHD